MNRNLKAWLVVLAALLPRFGIAQAADEHRPLKIAVAHLVHEATTFAPQTVGIDGFEVTDLTGEALFSYAQEIRGFVQFAREQDNVTLVPLRSPGEVAGGSSKGWITREAFEHYSKRMLDDLKRALPVDAVYLALHGAAAVQGIDRPEAELARRIRSMVGANVPIAGTFDPHGNEDAEFLRFANFSLVMKYYPHYDARLQGERAARLLIRTARGDYKPTTATRKPGIITPTVLQGTGQQPWMGIVQRALTWEAREKDVYVSYFFGYPWSDVPDLGATFQVMTNGNQKLADAIAKDMSDYMWAHRQELFNTKIVQPRDAVREAMDAQRTGTRPVVLADYSDRAGDATHILRQIVDLDIGGVLYATLRDERTLADMSKAGSRAGDAFDREVGGFVLPASGSPVRIKGKVVYFGQPARLEHPIAAGASIAVIEFGRGNLLVLTPELMQVTNPEEMRWGPILPERFTTWVLKSRVHFRRGFDDNGYAKKIVLVDAPGPSLGTVHLDALRYENVDIRKLFPFNESAANP